MEEVEVNTLMLMTIGKLFTFSSSFIIISVQGADNSEYFVNQHLWAPFCRQLTHEIY